MAPDLSLPIDELNLSVRAYNCLRRSGLATVGDVLQKKPEHLTALRNFALQNYREVRAALVSRGYPDMGLHPDDTDEIPPDDWPGDWPSGDRAPRRPPPGGFSAGAARPLP